MKISMGVMFVMLLGAVSCANPYGDVEILDGNGGRVTFGSNVLPPEGSWIDFKIMNPDGTERVTRHLSTESFDVYRFVSVAAKTGTGIRLECILPASVGYALVTTAFVGGEPAVTSVPFDVGVHQDTIIPVTELDHGSVRFEVPYLTKESDEDSPFMEVTVLDGTTLVYQESPLYSGQIVSVDLYPGSYTMTIKIYHKGHAEAWGAALPLTVVSGETATAVVP